MVNQMMDEKQEKDEQYDLITDDDRLTEQEGETGEKKYAKNSMHHPTSEIGKYVEMTGIGDDGGCKMRR